jgi:hypothetical protein
MQPVQHSSTTDKRCGCSYAYSQLAVRRHHNVVVVALANRVARIAWAVLAKEEIYRPAVLSSVAAA